MAHWQRGLDTRQAHRAAAIVTSMNQPPKRPDDETSRALEFERAARVRLEALRDQLSDLRAHAADDRKPIELDQQSVGRLSRQDAMQVQAMAQAADVRRAQELKRLNAALARVDAGAYGDCARCGDLIEDKRLTLDPATPFCAGCAR